MSDRLVWVDVETFGLDPDRDPILEIGFIITTLDLQPLSTFNTLIWEAGIYDTCYKRLLKDASNGNKDAQYVFDMHDKSGLWDEARADGGSTALAATEVHEWLDSQNINGTDPLCGSSVQFDRSMFRAQFPDIEERFHYRNIDISTVKELCRRYNPLVYGGLNTSAIKRELHRVIPDIEDSISEHQFYLDNFLYVGVDL